GLAGAKNKSEAARLLKKLDRDKHHKAAANALQESLAKDSGENIKRTISNGYIVGDFFEGVKNVPNMAVTMVELDPPYGIDLHNRTNNTDFGMREYNEVEIAEYPEFMKRVLTECFRVLSTDGWIVVWHGFQWYHMLMETLATVGFDPHHIPASWVKLDNPGQTKQPDLNLGSAHEPFIYARKGKPHIQTPGRNNLFAYKTLFPEWKIHPTERPIELVQDVFRTFCHPQGRVMIPFLGSGNSLLAASNLNLGCFGWDLSDIYKTGFLARVAEGTPGSYKSYKV
ncbi:MAG: DNA methyltransferase, partial [Patescibacteria group bacterium]